MRLRNLATFVKVVRTGSFHAAAQQLHASQPTISARINALEDELGVTLFSRDKSGTRLTARGAQLLPYAEKLLAISQEMRRHISEEQPEKGTLRIGITDTLAHLWLAKLLQSWQAQYPLITFELTCDVTQVLMRQLSNHQLDLALMVSSAQPQPELVTEGLCQYPQYWVASPSLVGKEQLHLLDQLAAYPLLSFPRETAPWHYLQQAFNHLDEAPMIHTCSSVANLLLLAQQGVGIALLPAPLVEPSIEQGSLIRLLPDTATPDLSFCYGWRLDDDRVLPRLLAESSREIMTHH